MHTCTHTRTHAITHARMRFVMLCSLKTFIIRKVIHGLFQIVSATLLGRLSFNAHKEIVIVLEDVSKKMERAFPSGNIGFSLSLKSKANTQSHAHNHIYKHMHAHTHAYIRTSSRTAPE